MCNIGFRFQQNDKYKFIFAANRDEMYTRPTQSAHFWPEYPNLLAGRDEVQKGTWLGITKQGKFAALTNCHQPPTEDVSRETKEYSTSRGTLVKSFLVGNQPAQEFAAELKAAHHEYDGYNLIFGNILDGQFLHYNNYDNQIQVISPGTHGLSNATLDTPWPKVRKVTTEIEHLSGNESEMTDRLFKLFSDRETAPRNQLPHTEIPVEFAEAASAVFIRTPEYGTIGTTVILVDQDNRVSFTERRFNQEGQIEENTFRFELEH